MRKLYWLTVSVTTLSMCSLLLSSCKDDDDPAKPKLSFAAATATGKESDATIEVELTLDKPAGEDITIEYTLGGTAYDNVRATAEGESADYTIDADDFGEVEIKKGETSGIITIVPFPDDLLEDDETITITIADVDTENIEYVATDIATVTLEQEDGVIISLTWPAPSTTGIADMDLIVRIGESASDWDGVVTGSAYRSYEYTEFVFIPKTYTGAAFGLGYTNTTFGLSYTYYDGSLNPLNFTVTFIDFANGAIEPTDQRQFFTASYSLSNLNKWSGTAYPTIVAQTFKNVGGVFSDISSITVQSSSSRSETSALSTLNNYIPAAFRNMKTLGVKKEVPQKFKGQF